MKTFAEFRARISTYQHISRSQNSITAKRNRDKTIDPQNNMQLRWGFQETKTIQKTGRRKNLKVGWPWVEKSTQATRGFRYERKSCMEAVTVYSIRIARMLAERRMGKFAGCRLAG